MHWRLIRFAAIAAVLLAGGLPAQPDAAHAHHSSALLQAQRHFLTDNLRQFTHHAKRVAPVYQPLMDYWLGVMQLRQRNAAPLVGVAQTSTSPYFRQHARHHLLRHAITHKQWHRYIRHARRGNDCEGVLRTILAAATSEEADKEKPPTISGSTNTRLRYLWQTDRKVSDHLCIALYRTAHRYGLLTADDIWIKVRTLAGSHNLAATKRLLYNFPRFVRYRTVRTVVRRAVHYVQSKHALDTRENREMLMVAAIAAARKAPKTALRRWGAFSQYYSADDNAYMWTMLGEWAARWHRDDALVLLKRGGGKYDTDITRAWRVRAALRAGDYADVLQTMEAMPAEEQSVSAWQYWRAIATQKTQGAAGTTAATAANEMLQKLADSHDDFYGLLAREAVGVPLVNHAAVPDDLPEPSGDLELALALRESGLLALAKTIWRFAREDKTLSVEARAAASAAADASGWHLAAINVADRSHAPAIHSLRFSTPYREEIEKYSKRFGLDPAFVYGLIRQESRFMPLAVSHANAQGLMQVIPRTAQIVAQRHKYTRYNLSRLKLVDTNLIIGTTYLAELARQFAAHPAKAAAGYNAGPTRIPRWFRASDDLLITIENIPITETRLYVKHLLANRVHYQAALGRPPTQFLTTLTHPITI